LSRGAQSAGQRILFDHSRSKEVFSMNSKVTSIVSALVLGLGLVIGLLALLPASSAVAEGPTGSISGDVTYSGIITGSHTIKITAWTALPPSDPPAGEATILLPGDSYTLIGLPDDSYFVAAFLDVNGNGEPDGDEPQAEYDADNDGNPDLVPVSDGGAVTDMDIVLEDPTPPPPEPGPSPETPTVEPTQEPTPEPPTLAATSTGSISGTIAYSGSLTGTIHVGAYINMEQPPVGSTQIAAPGEYEIAGLNDGDYHVHAFLDTDPLGQPPGPEDPKACYDPNGDGNPNPVTVSGGSNTADIDITLEDPPPTGAIVGTVTEEGDGSITNLHVIARDYATDQWAGGANTDAAGVYTITLPTGSYRVGTCSDCNGLNYTDEYYNNVLDMHMATQVDVVAPQTTGHIDFVLSQGGAISGMVKDEAGNPVTTAQINASPASGEPWGRGTHEIDSTGAYTITGLPPGSYKVEARAEGYDQEFYDNQTDWMLANVVTVTAGHTTPDIHFTLKKETGGAMEGRVVLPDGAGVHDAHVNAESMEHMLWKDSPTNENGDFRLTGITPGWWRVQAHPPQGEQYRNYSDSENCSVQESGTWVEYRPCEFQVPEGITPTLVITLPTVNVVGRVMMPDGSPAQHAPVKIEKTDWSLFTHADTDQEGYFRQGGLDTGDYQLRLEVPWGTSGIVPPEPKPFTIADINVLVDVGTITYTTAAKHIQGRVEHADHTGVPNAEVNAWQQSAEGWGHTQTDGSGNFYLDVAPGTWEVMIHPRPDEAADWVYMGHPKKVTFAGDASEETKTITFTVESANSRVTGRVVGPNGETLQPWSGQVDIRDMEGRGNGTPLSAGGFFTVSVGAGTYNVWIHVDEHTYPYWSSPHIPPFSIESNETKDLGTIHLVGKTSGITGTVTRASDSAGVAGVHVHAWQHEGGWADAMTNNDGYYSMLILSGTWEVDVEPPYTSTYVTGQPPQRVDVGDNETQSVNFVLTEANGVIQGTLKDPDGNVLTDINHGFAYARQGNAPEPIAGAPVDNGQFTIRVPSGTYNVGVWLPPNSGYTLSSEQEVGPLAMTEVVAKAQTRPEVAAANMSLHERQTSVQAGSTVTVTLTLVPNDARIVGGFYTDSGTSRLPAIGLMGEVFAMQGMGGAWQSTSIDPTDGSFELEVSAGTWNLGYWIMSSGYVNNPPPDTRVTIDSGEVFTFNFTVVETDATIEGVLQKPDHSPLNHAWAHAHRDRSETSAAIDTGDDSQPPDGRFSISVPSGGQYHVGAHAPESWGYIQPDFQVVSPTVGSSEFVTLTFKSSNGTITGTVYYHDEAGNPVYGPWAWVWGWSDEGQHTGAPTDHEGKYQLNVVTGTTWHIGACYQVEGGSLFYETTSPTDIVMDTPHKSADLHLYLASTALPPAVATTFDPSIGWTHTLSDGTYINIPAGAMPTTDTVRISITPLVEELQNTLTARPFGFGYAIVAYENSTGEQIVQNFNANVLITFYYTDEDLQRRGVSEDDLSPAYFSTTTNSWTKVESFSVDKPANKVTVQVNHFSTWALTAPSSQSDGGGGQSSVYLPIILKNR
jgi:hypothetical protein